MSRRAVWMIGLLATLALAGCPGGDAPDDDDSSAAGPDDDDSSSPGDDDDDDSSSTDDDDDSSAADDDDDSSGPVDEDGDGWTVDGGDCDDGDPEVYPGARELCDLEDSDCDGAADEGCPPVCGDGLVAGRYEECDGAQDDACPGLCSAHCACPAAGPGGLEVHVMDVGQGDGILVVSPDGFVTLLDSGSAGQGPAIAAYLAARGLPELDYTLVSHMHEDHLGAMDDVLAAHPEVVTCFDRGGGYSSTAFQQYAIMAGRRRAALAAGDTLDMGPGVVVDVLRGDTGSGNENDNSVVLRITHGGVSVLLGGDCETYDCEIGLSPGPIDVYKVHHHGSYSSSWGPLLDQMSPATALISAGQGNAYGHPHTQTLNRLVARGVEVYRTDHDGDLAMISDGTTYTVNGVPGP